MHAPERPVSETGCGGARAVPPFGLDGCQMTLLSLAVQNGCSALAGPGRGYRAVSIPFGTGRCTSCTVDHTGTSRHVEASSAAMGDDR